MYLPPDAQILNGLYAMSSGEARGLGEVDPRRLSPGPLCT